jgi:hypothetical protein
MAIPFSIFPFVSIPPNTSPENRTSFASGFRHTQVVDAVAM